MSLPKHWQRLFFLSITTALFSCAQTVLAATTSEIKTDGTISIGNSTRVILGIGGTINILRDNGDRYEAFIPISRAADGKSFHLYQLDDRKITVDAAKKTATWRGLVPAVGQGQPLPIEISTAVIGDSKVRVTVHYVTETPVEEILSGNGMQLQAPRAQHAGQQVEIDGQKTILSTDAPSAGGGKPLYAGTGLPTTTFFPGDAERSLTITPIEVASVSVFDSNRPTQPLVHERFKPKGNFLIYDIEFSGVDKVASPETYFGVDYMAVNRFRLPRYGVSRNLVQNSGFEAGFHGWRFGRAGTLTESRLGEYYQIENGDAVSAKRSLKILGEKEQSPAHLNTFAIPVETGAEYTLSFYARAEQANVQLSLNSGTVNWGTFVARKFTLTNEWKRYSFSFKAPNEMMNVDFGIDRPAADSVAWLDNVQLEKGPLTDYDGKLVSGSVVTNGRGNWVQPGEKVGALLDLSGKSGTTGTAAIKVTDFFGEVVREESKAFTLGADGSARIALDWAQNLGRGLFLVETNLKAGDFSDRDFSRITIMPFADNTAPHKNLFSYGGEDQRIGSWARRLDFYKRAGIGSGFLHTPPPHQYLKSMADNRVLDVSSIFDNSDTSGKWFLKENYHLTDAELQIVEENAFKKAMEYSEISYWRLVNEPGSKMSANLDEMKAFVRPMLAAYRGIKRANPKALVLSPDPSNLAPQNGIAWMDMFFEAGGKASCDLIAIHPYRTRPEEPDLDSDIATFFKMLDRHGYKGDVWFTEGMSNFGMNLPAWGVDTHRALSQEGGTSGGWRVGTLTYDVGLGERAAAAYGMRYWLTALKYGDRIKQYVSWYYPANSTLDYDMTPGGDVIASNTLTHLLGDSTFKQDIELGEGLRGYLFIDGKKQPLAALWSHDIRVDKGESKGTLVDISSLPANIELIDFTGRKLVRTKEIRISSCSIFVRGAVGSANTLAKALSELPVSSTTGRQLIPFVKVTGNQSAEVRLQNLLSRPAQGRVQIVQNGKTLFDGNVTIAGKTIWSNPLPITTETGRLTPQKVGISFTPTDGGQNQVSEIALETLAIPRTEKPIAIDGDLTDWPTTSALPLPKRIISFKNKPAHTGNADLSGTFYSAWDADNLYLAFDIKDDSFAPGPRSNQAWEGDGVQIYFDSFQNAGAATKPSFDSDDQNFDIWYGPDGVEVRRVITPDVQLAFLKAGVVESAKKSLKRTADGYILELAIPKRELAPIDFKAGGSFGFSFIINDKDDEASGRKRGLTLTPEGTEPFNHPELFTVVTLRP